MNTIKTIVQHKTTYHINQIGNRTFRIAYTTGNESCIHHVDAIFDTPEDAEAYITSISNSDALIAQIIDKGAYHD